MPDRARTVFPCFDQPDLKASFTLELEVPEHWKAVSNNVLEEEEHLKAVSNNVLEEEHLKTVSDGQLVRELEGESERNITGGRKILRFKPTRSTITSWNSHKRHLMRGS